MPLRLISPNWFCRMLSWINFLSSGLVAIFRSRKCFASLSNSAYSKWISFPCPTGTGKTHLANDLAILSIILLFREIRGWKSRKIVRDLWRAQKGNSYPLKGKSIKDYLTDMNNKYIIWLHLIIKDNKY